MTLPPLMDAWVLEADADLIMARYDDTTQIVRAWAAQCGLPDEASFDFQYSGLTTTGPQDSFSVSGEATPNQVSELASRLSRAYDTRIVVRRTQLIAVPQLDMTSGQPTGKYAYFDPEVAERARRPEEDERELN
ncbi:hypothetical protein E7T09_04310 [Deinococcus sp. KSM4-11]|uniref:hypothetical protein n=1 Tax=Deinococcus sp. KSM4-11 TaxID=2568654 RepID=UPI0010A39686|nr:hypothetical protein [Deinococcus sp. KSM4-11]THF88437.1 hypothetical protein E7T09_04310 [Deinococcus sp. KSM4-11]